jgi:ABC-type Fe3+ transport system permease subunit/DNA-binding beta-propeller fold protein YncE
MNWSLLQNSLMVAGLATAFAGVAGFGAALWLSGLGRRGRAAFLILATVALALPPFLVTGCWMQLLSSAGLPIERFVTQIATDGGWRWQLGLVGLTALVLALMLWPITLFLTLGAWQQVEPSHLESEPVLTGTPLVRWLLWPMGRGAVGQAAAVTLVLALNDFAVPALFQVKVFPAEVWVRFNTTFDSVGALALSAPMILAPLLLLLWLRRSQVAWPRLDGVVPARSFRQQVGPRLFGVAGVVTVGMLALSVGMPLGELVLAKRTWVELGEAALAGQDAIWNSLLLAAAAATLIVGVSVLSLIRAPKAVLKAPHSKRCRDGHASPDRAKRLECGGFGAACGRWQGPPGLKPGSSSGVSLLTRFPGLLLWLPFLAPGVLLGIALIYVCNRPWLSALYQSAAIVLLAWTIRYLAIGWHGLAHAFDGIDRDLVDAARLDGAKGWQLWRWAVWPQVAPQVGAVWFVTYLLCLWDVETLVLIVPPGGETLSLRIFNLLHYGHNAQVSALCLVLLGLAVLPLALGAVTTLQSPITKGCMRFAVTALGPAAGLFLSGCSPSSPNTALVESQIFSHVEVIGTRGVGPGQFSKPRSVAVDAQDNLYVVDMTGRVQKFSPNGRNLAYWQMEQTDLGKPKGMSRDADGNLIVIEPHYARMNHYTPDGKLVAQWGGRGTNAGQLIFPRAAAVNSRGEIYVSEYTVADRVQRFGPRGTNWLGAFGKGGRGPGEFSRAEGLGIDAQDRLYVADSCNHRVQVFDADGKFLRMYGQAGTGPGELSYPYDVRIDREGRQYVCEFGNSRIQVFGQDDKPLEVLGGRGGAAGQFSNPWSIALDSHDNLYVADAMNHRVQKFVRRKSAVRSQRPVTSHQWSVISGQWLVVSGQKPEVRHRMPDAGGHSSLLTRHWSLITDHWSQITDHFVSRSAFRTPHSP